MFGSYILPRRRRSAVRVSRIFLLVVSTCLLLGQAIAQSAGPWPMFRGDRAHQGRSVHVGPVFPSIQWSLDLGSGAYASPAIGADGTSYVASSRRLLAVAPDGSVRWSSPLGGFTVSSPALGPGGRVFVGSNDGLLYAFRRADGTVLWTFQTGGEIWSSPVVGTDGTVFVGNSDGAMVALDPGDGTEKWRFNTEAEIITSPAIDGAGRLYVVDRIGRGYVLQSATGTLMQTFSVPSEVASSPAVGSDGTVYFGGLDGNFYAVETNTGNVRWSASVGGRIVASPAIGENGTVYIGSDSGVLAAVDAASGRIRWTTELDAAVYSSPSLDAAAQIYVGTSDSLRDDGSLYGVNGTDGSILWQHPIGKPVWSSPAIDADGAIYVASASNDLSTGRLYRIERAYVRIEFRDDVAGTVTVTPVTAFNPTSGTIFFRRGGEDQFASASLEPAANQTFTGIVPEDFVTPRGLEYYVALSDGNQTRTFPTSNAVSRPAVKQVLVERLEVPNVPPPRSYRMVSVPLELQDPDVASVLLDDYGEADRFSWRLLRWQGDRYREYPNLDDDFEPGIAFFLINRMGVAFTVENGRSVDTSEPFEVTLRPGWNQVGVPFAFPIDWNDVVVLDEEGASAVRDIAFFDGEQMLQDVSAFNPLRPWSGYFIRNALDRPVRIAFPPRAAEQDIDVVTRTSIVSPAATSDGFVLGLEAHSLASGLLDTQNWVGLAPGADAEDDDRDIHEAPPTGEHLRLSIIQDDARYAANIVSPRGRGHQWRMELAIHPRPERTEWIEVTLVPHGQRPDGYDLRLVDDDRQQAISVLDNTFRVAVGGDTPVRQLRLAVGTTAFLDDALEGTSPESPSFFLDQNAPNPFAGSTTIHYRMERSAHVVLEIYDAIGRRVSTLLDEEQGAGVHRVTWDGRGTGGRLLPSGVYFCRMRAGSFIQTQSVTVLR